MAKLAHILRQLVDEEAASHGAFVVGQSSGEKGLFRFYVDAEGSLTMPTITEITRGVSSRIDELETGDEAFTFEVSSPGADSPLVDLRQYGKHVGRNFEMETAELSFTGKLMQVSGSELHFEETRIEKINGKKTTLVETRVIPFEQIQKATIKISFK
jgi:ribosome maturation factor RimP